MRKISDEIKKATSKGGDWMSIVDVYIGISKLLLLLFLLFVVMPLMVSVTEYFRKKIIKIVRNKKIKY